MIESFLVALCMAILEKLITKGSIAFSHYMALKKELDENDEKYKKYKKVVDDPKATREERRKAEDDVLS